MTAPDRTQLLAHYIIFRAQPEKLGAVKLNKVMWFADLEAYQLFGRTITGQTSYQKQKFGPVPNNILKAISGLIKDEKVTRRNTATPAGDRHEYVWLQRPDVSPFTAEEIDIANRAIDWVCNNYSAAGISDKTHDPLWEETDLGDQIEVRAATVSAKPISGRYREWAQAVNADA